MAAEETKLTNTQLTPPTIIGRLLAIAYGVLCGLSIVLAWGTAGIGSAGLWYSMGAITAIVNMYMFWWAVPRLLNQLFAKDESIFHETELVYVNEKKEPFRIKENNHFSEMPLSKKILLSVFFAFAVLNALTYTSILLNSLIPTLSGLGGVLGVGSTDISSMGLSSRMWMMGLTAIIPMFCNVSLALFDGAALIADKRTIRERVSDFSDDMTKQWRDNPAQTLAKYFLLTCMLGAGLYALGQGVLFGAEIFSQFFPDALKMAIGEGAHGHTGQHGWGKVGTYLVAVPGIIAMLPFTFMALERFAENLVKLPSLLASVWKTNEKKVSPDYATTLRVLFTALLTIKSCLIGLFALINASNNGVLAAQRINSEGGFNALSQEDKALSLLGTVGGTVNSYSCYVNAAVAGSSGYSEGHTQELPFYDNLDASVQGKAMFYFNPSVGRPYYEPIQPSANQNPSSSSLSHKP